MATHLSLALPLPSPPRRAKSLGISPGLDVPKPHFPHIVIEIRGRKEVVDDARRVEQMVAVADMQIDPDEEDEELADEFPIPTAETRSAARSLAGRIVLGTLRANPDRPLVPRFGAAGDGGVALHWRTARLELLLTLSPDSSRARYYGELASGSHIKGSFSLSDHVGFLARWLADNELSEGRDPSRSSPLQVDSSK